MPKPVVFRPFLGVGPRRYFDLFSMSLGNGYAVKRKAKGVKAAWERGAATPRVPLLEVSFLDEEEAGIAEVENICSASEEP